MPQCAIVTDIRNAKELAAYYNNFSLGENIVSHIITYRLFQAGRLLDKEYREWVRKEFQVIERDSTKTGRPFAYSLPADLHARFEMKTHGYIHTPTGKWDGFTVIKQSHDHGTV